MPLYYDLLLGSEPDPAEPPVKQKRTLAHQIVARFHDSAAADAAEAHFDKLFKSHDLPDDIEEFSIAANGSDIHMPGLLAEAFGLSRSEARRLIEQGGVSLDGEAIPADRLDLPPAELDGKVIKVGKRRFKRLKA
jgi:tyrosyl-tRNA synthetase